MELIRRLGVRLSKIGESYLSWGLFKCPDICCGQEVERQLGAGLKAKSCGSPECKENKGNYKHGESNTRLYRVWYNMKQRILNLKKCNYKNYGGRGITICPEWAGSYIVFRNWALNNGYANNLQIDRKNTDGNYEPNNCRFISAKENANNRRSRIPLEIANEIRYLYSTGNYTQKELAEKFNVSQMTISNIINKTS